MNMVLKCVNRIVNVDKGNGVAKYTPGKKQLLMGLYIETTVIWSSRHDRND